MNGHEIAGSVIGVGGIGGIITTFILGRNGAEAEQSIAPEKADKESRKQRAVKRKS